MQTVLLNCLTSEFIVIRNSLENDENVVGVFLLNTYIFVYGQGSRCRFDFRGNLQEKYEILLNMSCFKTVMVKNYLFYRCRNSEPPSWPIHLMNFASIDTYWVLFWSGSLDDTRLKLRSVFNDDNYEAVEFYRLIFL